MNGNSFVERKSQELLKYGEILEDEKSDQLQKGNFRKRLIKYQNEYYIHVMLNGNVIAIERLKYDYNEKQCLINSIDEKSVVYDNVKKIRNLLKYTLKENGYTYDLLGKKMDVSRQYISILINESQLKPNVIKKILDIIDYEMEIRIINNHKNEIISTFYRENDDIKWIINKIIKSSLISKVNVAKLIGMSRQNFDSFVNRKKCITLNDLKRICDVLDYRINIIFKKKR